MLGYNGMNANWYFMTSSIKFFSDCQIKIWQALWYEYGILCHFTTVLYVTADIKNRTFFFSHSMSKKTAVQEKIFGQNESISKEELHLRWWFLKDEWFHSTLAFEITPVGVEFAYAGWNVTQYDCSFLSCFILRFCYSEVFLIALNNFKISL